MKRNIQLDIPTPCSKRWEDMQSAEKGRYCGACSKTVVDFSMMSDREIIGYLSRAGQQVCGRLAADQLNKGMTIQPDAAQTRQVWWKWLLAGLLISSEASAQRHPIKRTVATAVCADLGHMIKVQIARVEPDNVPATSDTIKIKVLPPVIVSAYASKTLEGSLGGISIGQSVRVKGDSLVRRIKDTLATIGLLPKKEWNVYPNPARRGSPVMLTWQTAQAGSYEVALFNTQGALIQQRQLQVENKDQVDLLDIPSSLASGVYFLSATAVGSGKPVTRKLVIL